MSWKARVYQLLEAPDAKSRVAFVIRTALVGLILLSAAAVILETVESIRRRFDFVLLGVERFAVIVFTVEYISRVWSITAVDRFSEPIKGRIRYALTPLAIVDLLAILPTYFALGVSSELLTLRALRLVRMFRLFKLAHYSTAFRSLGAALRSKREEITIVLFVLAILLVIASSLMYYAENEAQPSQFSSIPAAMWWGVVTLTTVGYGDVYPVTPMGKVIGAFVAILGAGLFALPAAIWGAAFIENALRHDHQVRSCPHCGRRIEDDIRRPDQNRSAESE